MGNQSEECGDWEILTFPPRLAAPRAARIAVGSRHPPLTIGKRKCQYCISRCMDNSHQLRDKTVCGGFGKAQEAVPSTARALSFALAHPTRAAAFARSALAAAIAGPTVVSSCRRSLAACAGSVRSSSAATLRPRAIPAPPCPLLRNSLKLRAPPVRKGLWCRAKVSAEVGRALADEGSAIAESGRGLLFVTDFVPESKFPVAHSSSDAGVSRTSRNPCLAEFGREDDFRPFRGVGTRPPLGEVGSETALRCRVGRFFFSPKANPASSSLKSANASASASALFVVSSSACE